MNQETIEAIKELENGEGKRFTGSTKELFRELISEHIPAEKENVKKCSHYLVALLHVMNHQFYQ